MPEEPKQKLTSWLTHGIMRPDKTIDFDRTRVMTPEQKAWYQATLALNDEYFNNRVEVDMLLMMAFKGRRSDDIVEAMHSTDQADKINTGVQPVNEELRRRQNKYKTDD